MYLKQVRTEIKKVCTNSSKNTIQTKCIPFNEILKKIQKKKSPPNKDKTNQPLPHQKGKKTQTKKHPQNKQTKNQSTMLSANTKKNISSSFLLHLPSAYRCGTQENHKKSSQDYKPRLYKGKQ